MQRRGVDAERDPRAHAQDLVGGCARCQPGRGAQPQGHDILMPGFFFLFVLVLGLFYELKKGAIEWDQ
jgi:hypothetical protein